MTCIAWRSFCSTNGGADRGKPDRRILKRFCVLVYKDLEGTQARASGKLGRRRGASAATAKVDTIIVPGMKGWADLTDAEIREGCKYDGIGIVTEKKFSEFRGETYRSMQLGMMGETFLFRGIDPAIFEQIPTEGPLKVSGHLEAKVVNTTNGLIPDLLLQLEEVKVFGQPAEKPEPRQESPSQDKKTA